MAVAEKPPASSTPPAGKLRGGMAAAARVPHRAWEWGKQHPRSGMAVAASMALVLAPLLAVWVLRPVEVPEEPATLARALKALDAHNDAFARKLALELQSAPLAEGEAGGPSFVLGVVASREADRSEDNTQRYSMLAARYLREAYDAGFPPGREGEGLLLLGKNLLRAGQVDASQEILEAALEANPAEAAMIHRMLCDAYLNDAPPKLAEALAHNRAYLETANLEPGPRSVALLQQAAILLRQGYIEPCKKLLESIPQDAAAHPEAEILAAQAMLAEAEDAHNAPAPEDHARLCDAARQKLQAVLDSLPQGDARRAQAAYQLGVCYQALGQAAAAKEQFARVQEEFPDSVEALTAGIQGADLLRKEGRHDESIGLYDRLLRTLRTRDAPTEWMALDQLRRRSMAAYQYYFDAGEFQRSLQLVDALRPLISPPERFQLAASARRAWAQSLMNQLEQAEVSQQRQLRQQAEELFRAAGKEFSRLAEERFTTREYPEDLWASAECYLAAHDYADAHRILEDYLKHEPTRRRPSALVRLGECLLMENRPSDAVGCFREAIGIGPTDSAIYRGRILASQAYLELDNPEAAERMLLDNLENDLLTPASLEWRESLFRLGKLYYLTSRYAEAIKRLEEAVRRYPQSSETPQARYLIGESYRQQARTELARRDTALVESARNVHAREAHRMLESAIAAYNSATRSIEGRRELTQDQALLLRNCRYMKAAALFDLGRFEEAIQSYSTAINQYQHSPVVLDAYVRVADCLRRLNRPLEAKGTIEQAKVVLNRLPADADFSDTSSFDRQEWQRYLDWLGSL